jgi:hypothetical protein
MTQKKLLWLKIHYIGVSAEQIGKTIKTIERTNFYENNKKSYLKALFYLQKL